MLTKGNKFLKNIKTQWINMLSPTKRVLFEYKTLLAKMATDCVELQIVETNFDLLFKLILLGLVGLLPLLEIVHGVIKFSQ
jgi:hypothetical protein